MEVFPSFFVYCKSLGHSKADCRILHPHLNVALMHITKPATTVYMANNNHVSHGCSPMPHTTKDNLRNNSLIIVDDLDDLSDVNEQLLCDNVGFEPFVNVDLGRQGVVDRTPLNQAPSRIHNSVLPSIELLLTVIKPVVRDCAFNCVDGFEHSKKNVNDFDLSLLDSNELDVLSKSMEVNDFMPLIDDPISLISNDVLCAHLALKLKDTCVDQSDWLIDFDSSAN
ncbi:hypothetical protein IEQ34_009832 [Dendrobium chrysotoxum]|uniref:Uncharacterized protein n=1 Tax=Dendrobium chrysotoxum TaxID=161865 RepID=A0AAV7H333_DENCH|nr:hypothetical protein IEQ34_009832 [Dendrobium chrysotoxum]